MGSNTGSWILFGLVAVVASLASAENIQISDVQSIYQNNGNTFLSNSIQSADGNNVNSISNSITIDGRSLSYSSGNHESITNGNGHSMRVTNGVIEITEKGQVYTFRPKAKTVTEKKTVTVNGQPAQVEYSNGDIIVELADHTVAAIVGNRIFIGNRYSFDNRDKLEADDQNRAVQLRKNLDDHFKKVKHNLEAHLKATFANLFPKRKM